MQLKYILTRKGVSASDFSEELNKINGYSPPWRSQGWALGVALKNSASIMLALTSV
jgi:hypothetical protein